MNTGPIGCDDFEDVLIEVERGDFSIGQCYENEPAKTLLCKKCGADTFTVGCGECFTAIKCNTCKWEQCIHDG